MSNGGCSNTNWHINHFLFSTYILSSTLCGYLNGCGSYSKRSATCSMRLTYSVRVHVCGCVCAPNHCSTADEAWYWLKCILYSVQMTLHNILCDLLIVHALAIITDNDETKAPSHHPLPSYNDSLSTTQCHCTYLV